MCLPTFNKAASSSQSAAQIVADIHSVFDLRVAKQQFFDLIMRLLLVQCAVLNQETFCDHIESLVYLLRKGPIEWSDQDIDSLANEIEKLRSY